MGQESYLQMSPEIMTCGPSPGLVHPAAVNLPDRTNRVLLTAGGVTHRPHLAIFQTRGGCIDRLQDGIVGRRRGESTDRSLEHQKRSQTDGAGQRLAAEVGLRS